MTDKTDTQVLSDRELDAVLAEGLMCLRLYQPDVDAIKSGSVLAGTLRTDYETERGHSSWQVPRYSSTYEGMQKVLAAIADRHGDVWDFDDAMRTGLIQDVGTPLFWGRALVQCHDRLPRLVAEAAAKALGLIP